MGTQQDPTEREAAGTTASKTTLHIEMQSSERQVLTSFREQFMRWINDRAATGFAHHVGTPQKISFEEGEADDTAHSAILNLDLIWSSRDRASTRSSERATITAAVPAPPAPAIEPTQRFVFFPDPDSEAPRHHAASLFDGTTLHQVPSRIEWVRMERPASLELMHKAVQLSVSAYEHIKSVVAGIRRDPSRLLRGAAASSRSFLPGPVRVRMPKPVSTPDNWLPSLRTGSMFAAVALTTLVLVVAAYESRSSDVVTAGETTRATAPRSRDVMLPAPLPVPGTTLTTTDSLPVAAPTAVSLAANTAPSRFTPSEPATPSLVATKGNASPAVAPLRIVEPGRAEAPDNAAPLRVVARDETVGSLVVASEPAGAAVSINGVTHGYTPLQIENLAAGTRVVRLELPGYERWSWAVNVVANKRTPVTVKLQPEARRLGASN